MDMVSFETDLRREAKKLPPDLLVILRDLADKFGPKLEGIVMPMISALQRHFMAAMAEISMGVLDRKELETVVFKVLKEIV